MHGVKTIKFEFSLKSWYTKLVLELILNIGKALKCGYLKVHIYVCINKYKKQGHHKNQTNNLAWLLNYEIWILLEKLRQKTCLGIDFRHQKSFKMLIWRCMYVCINKYKNKDIRKAEKKITLLPFKLWNLNSPWKVDKFL